MRPQKEVHGISSSNTIRRKMTILCHHGKGVICTGIGCMIANTKWGYSSRANNRKFPDGFRSVKRDRCSEHGHRMCTYPIVDKMTTHKKRQNNKSLVFLNNIEEGYDPQYDNELEYGEYNGEEIQEEIDYGYDETDYENEEFDSECEDIDSAYVEYEKMRKDEVDLDAAYREYEKMKDDEWVILENEN